MTQDDANGVVQSQLSELANLATRVSREMAADIEAFGERVVATLQGGGTLFFCGNGGSAADAQHLAAEYVVRFLRERRALAAMALTTDTSILTAGGNDYGFETVFARQVEALAKPGDLLIIHSTSGNSPNLVKAAEQARRSGVATVALLAKGGGALKERVDLALVVPTDVTARAQEVHLAIGHIVCEMADAALTES